MEGLLPCVPYRQWVLVLPKRLRWFVHRNPALAGEVSRLLASEITRFYRERTLQGRGGHPIEASTAPAQVLVVQRFGGKANLHVHFHAVVSDGVFALREGLGVTGKLQFIPAPEPSPTEIADLCERLRRSILRPKRRTQRREEVVAASSRNRDAWSGSALSPENPSGRCSHDCMEGSLLTQACAWRRTTGRP
ncbi:MAG: transposase [Elusimicrobia bacterium]|nr:transposase [Elusimicrobiota bacterium]